MSDIIAVEGDSVRLYQYNFEKPDLSDELLENNGIDNSISHYNHNHDPKNGQFTTGHGGSISGGGGSKLSGRALRKKKKQLKKARKVRATNAKRRIKEQAKQRVLDKSKEDIIKSKDVSSMLKKVDQFSNKEIEDMLNRLSTEDKLRSKVKEIEKSKMSTGKKIREGLKESIKRGAANAGKSMVSTVTENALKMGTKALLKETVGQNNEEIERMIEQLFKEKKK